jgi:hypothetical protein
VPSISTPTRGILPGCAAAESGKAAAPLKSKNSRRFIIVPRPIGLMRRSRFDSYSMISSARASSDAGGVNPNAFAVFMLMIISYLIGN